MCTIFYFVSFFFVEKKCFPILFTSRTFIRFVVLNTMLNCMFYICFTFVYFSHRYISDVHRIAQVHNFKPKVDDVNEINSWGLGTTMPSSASHSNNNNPLLKDTPIR